MCLTLVICALPSTASCSQEESLEDAFSALEKYDFGSDRDALEPIDAVILTSRADDDMRQALEERFMDFLKGHASRGAKAYVCRKLGQMGTSRSVPVLSWLLDDDELGHMARGALELIPGPEATKALRDALPKTKGLLKVGVINSLGVRRDAESGPALVALLGDSDQQVASAAAAALGAIGSSDGAKALAAFQAKAPEALRLAVADARLICAERLLADGKKLEAMAIYKALSTPEQPKHVRLAATRGLLAAAGKK